MTEPHAPLTNQQLDEIDTRAAHLFEYVTMPHEADQLAGVDVPALLAEVRRRVEPIALPARWDCAHGPSDDEPYCAAEDGHVCPTIRVHPADAEAFAALVDEVHRLHAELERPTVEAKRAETRQSLTELAAQAEQERDFEGAFNAQCRLREFEERWALEDNPRPTPSPTAVAAVARELTRPAP